MLTVGGWSRRRNTQIACDLHLMESADAGLEAKEQPYPELRHRPLHSSHRRGCPKNGQFVSWRDTSTLLRYQQPDPRTMRAVVEFEQPPERGPTPDQAVSNSLSYSLTPRK